MDTAFLVVTNRCSRRCAFCFYSTGYLSPTAGEMDAAGLFSALERLAGMGIRQVIITGGEPLLRPETVEVVRRAAAMGLGTLLLTNADPLDARAAAALVDAGLGGVSLSVNSPADAAMIDRVLPSLGGGRLAVTATVVMSGANAADLRALYDWAAARRIGIILQPAFVPPGAEGEAELSPRHFGAETWRRAAGLLEEWGKAQPHAAAYVRYILALYGKGTARPPRCGMGTDALVVDCDGAVYPCFHRRD
ncbi:MAG: radical SAM protein, partial [bacterium]|nr:radical SAM protein [bacterium]